MWMTPTEAREWEAECGELERLGAGRSQAQEARLIEVRQILSRADTGRKPDDGIIEPGMVVTVEFDDATRERFLLGTRARPEQTVVSVDSPIGAALNGRRIGDIATYLAPNGERLSVRVLAATPHEDGPEAD